MSAFRNQSGRPPRPGRKRAPARPGPVLDRELLEILSASEVPLGAYEIAARLGEDGRHVVIMSVYRSLDRLCARQQVEKVEMTSAFRIKDAARAVLMICVECGRTRSLLLPDHHRAIELALAEAGFAINRLALEAAGTCRQCRTRTRS